MLQLVRTMNIFVLDYDISLAAKYHCDKHIVKMVLETAQLLSGVKILHGETAAYKMSKGHLGHPCTKWAAESLDNFNWLHELGLELCDEYTRRYNKTHLSQEKVIDCIVPPKTLTSKGLTPFARAFRRTMPAENLKRLLDTEDVVDAYRLYYNLDKPFAEWRYSEKPYWYKPETSGT